MEPAGMVANTRSLSTRASDAVPNSLVVARQTIIRSGVKPESEVKERPNTIRVRNAAQRSGGNRQGGDFSLEHGIEPSDNIDALAGIVSQPLIVHVRERREQDDATRRKSKITQNLAEMRAKFLKPPPPQPLRWRGS